jgi:hypothetical protein
MSEKLSEEEMLEFEIINEMVKTDPHFYSWDGRIPLEVQRLREKEWLMDELIKTREAFNSLGNSNKADSVRLSTLLGGKNLSWFTKQLIEIRLQDLEKRIERHKSGEEELIPEAVKDYKNDIKILKEFLRTN